MELGWKGLAGDAVAVPFENRKWLENKKPRIFYEFEVLDLFD